MIHQLRRLIGYEIIRLGWRIYPACDERMVLTRYLADWSLILLKSGKE